MESKERLAFFLAAFDLTKEFDCDWCEFGVLNKETLARLSTFDVRYKNSVTNLELDSSMFVCWADVSVDRETDFLSLSFLPATLSHYQNKIVPIIINSPRIVDLTNIF